MMLRINNSFVLRNSHQSVSTYYAYIEDECLWRERPKEYCTKFFVLFLEGKFVCCKCVRKTILAGIG